MKALFISDNHGDAAILERVKEGWRIKLTLCFTAAIQTYPRMTQP